MNSKSANQIAGLFFQQAAKCGSRSLVLSAKQLAWYRSVADEERRAYRDAVDSPDHHIEVDGKAIGFFDIIPLDCSREGVKHSPRKMVFRLTGEQFPEDAYPSQEQLCLAAKVDAEFAAMRNRPTQPRQQEEW